MLPALVCLLELAVLKLETYSNAAAAGPPVTTTTVRSLDFTVPDLVGSAEVSGTLTHPADTFHAFRCSFSSGAFYAFVWLDDHLICHTNPPFGNTASSTDGSPAYPLPAKLGQAATVVVKLSRTGTLSAPINASVNVQWSPLAEPTKHDAKLSYVDIPAAILTPVTSRLEEQRRSLQDSLKGGWNLWGYNLLGIVQLPQSHVLTMAVCQLSTGKCLNQTTIEDTHAQIRVGPFATDASYFQLFVGYQGLNVSLSVAGGSQQNLSVLVEPVSCPQSNFSDYALVVLPRFQWDRTGVINISTSDGTIGLAPFGFVPSFVRPTSAPSAALPKSLTAALGLGGHDSPAAPPPPPHVAFSLGHGAVGFREAATAKGALPTVSDVKATVEAARKAELERYEAYGAYAEVKEALQAATMWNYILSPAELGPILPVSRSWNFVKEESSLDWSYVIFDWDNFFASFMASLDPRAKRIAYSNLIQVVRSRTAMGFVPNYSAGGSKSVDRTEPPVGAKVLLEMHKKYPDDTWLVELLFEDLLGWNDWMARARTLGPLGIVSLGSDTIDGYGDWSAGMMQGARYESGLDNSPMYDGSFFSKNMSAQGTHLVGQMTLYDVGMASMFVQEAESLARLAPVAGRPEMVAPLKARAKAQRDLIAEHLWDDSSGIFVNKFHNGTFYRRI
jgi:putative isomerase